MPVNYCLLSRLRKKIRYGEEPDNPDLLSYWFQLETTLAEKNFITTDSRRELFENQFALLLDALADELVPRQWRCLCLDNIYRPLGELKRLIRDPRQADRHRALLAELATTSRYVQHSLVYNYRD